MSSRKKTQENGTSVLRVLRNVQLMSSRKKTARRTQRRTRKTARQWGRIEKRLKKAGYQCVEYVLAQQMTEAGLPVRSIVTREEPIHRLYYAPPWCNRLFDLACQAGWHAPQTPLHIQVPPSARGLTYKQQQVIRQLIKTARCAPAVAEATLIVHVARYAGASGTAAEIAVQRLKRDTTFRNALCALGALKDVAQMAKCFVEGQCGRLPKLPSNEHYITSIEEALEA
jgi:hypothetical protein